MNSRKTRFREARRRAGRTFLQTACGGLCVGLAAAVSGVPVQGWQICLSALTAALISAGLAAVMNLHPGKDA